MGLYAIYHVQHHLDVCLRESVYPGDDTRIFPRVQDRVGVSIDLQGRYGELQKSLE